MKKERVEFEGLTLIGLTVRTHNKNETNPETSKIGAIAGSYWGNQIANGFKDRVNPGVTYAVYTEFESDETGEYTYFIGEEIKSPDKQDQSKFTPLVIPAGAYQKFTTEPGKMPDIVIASWQKILQMRQEELGGQRKYLADFEIYDQRASNPNNSVIDIYIGIE